MTHRHGLVRAIRYLMIFGLQKHSVRNGLKFGQDSVRILVITVISGILFDDEVRSGYHSMKAKLYFDKDMKQKSNDTTCTQSSSDQYQSAL